MPKRSKNTAAKGLYSTISLSATLEKFLGFHQHNDSNGLQRFVRKFKAGLVSGGVGDGKQIFHALFLQEEAVDQLVIYTIKLSLSLMTLKKNLIQWCL